MALTADIIKNMVPAFYIKKNDLAVEIYALSNNGYVCELSIDAFEVLSRFWASLDYKDKLAFDDDMLNFMVEFNISETEYYLGRKVVRHWEK